MLVKICGISTLEAAQVAADEGADLIGFVFAPSTRRIEPSKAKEIVNNLPSSLKTVGVFVNETTTNIEKIAQEIGLDIFNFMVMKQLSLHVSYLYQLLKQLI